MEDKNIFIRNAEKWSDYFVKVSIMFTTFIALLYFSEYYQRFELQILALLFLLAIVIIGMTKFMEVYITDAEPVRIK